jgi:hypothetical protein
VLASARVIDPVKLDQSVGSKHVPVLEKLERVSSQEFEMEVLEWHGAVLDSKVLLLLLIVMEE